MVNRCYKKAVESCNYILLWCPVAYELWTIVYSLLRTNWVMSGSVKEELWTWKGLCTKRQFVKFILLTILWVLWKGKNSRTVEGSKGEIAKIKDRWLHFLGPYFWDIFLDGRFWESYQYSYTIVILCTRVLLSRYLVNITIYTFYFKKKYSPTHKIFMWVDGNTCVLFEKRVLYKHTF